MKKLYKIAVRQSPSVKRTLKTVAWYGIAILERVRDFKTPNEISLINYQMLLGTWDATVSTLMRRFLAPGSVFVDVGAHVGYFTRQACRLVGQGGTVYAFEANNENFARLTYNLRRYSSALLFPQAVGAVQGEVIFYDSPIGSGRHSMIASRNEISSSRIVPVVSLDHILNGKQVDLIKIDVEGAELQVLEGMQQTLRANPNAKIIVEFFPKLYSDQGLPPWILLEKLQQLGFMIYHLIDAATWVRIENPKTFTEQLQQKYINVLATKSYV